MKEHITATTSTGDIICYNGTESSEHKTDVSYGIQWGAYGAFLKYRNNCDSLFKHGLITCSYLL